jgi:hypothetical protein
VGLRRIVAETRGFLLNECLRLCANLASRE